MQSCSARSSSRTYPPTRQLRTSSKGHLGWPLVPMGPLTLYMTPAAGFDGCREDLESAGKVEGDEQRRQRAGARSGRRRRLGGVGHGAFTGMLVGSVSIHCVTNASCPVVVVRHSNGN